MESYVDDKTPSVLKEAALVYLPFLIKKHEGAQDLAELISKIELDLRVHFPSLSDPLDLMAELKSTDLYQVFEYTRLIAEGKLEALTMELMKKKPVEVEKAMGYLFRAFKGFESSEATAKLMAGFIDHFSERKDTRAILQQMLFKVDNEFSRAFRLQVKERLEELNARRLLMNGKLIELYNKVPYEKKKKLFAYVERAVAEGSEKARSVRSEMLEITNVLDIEYRRGLYGAVTYRSDDINPESGVSFRQSLYNYSISYPNQWEDDCDRSPRIFIDGALYSNPSQEELQNAINPPYLLSLISQGVFAETQKVGFERLNPGFFARIVAQNIFSEKNRFILVEDKAKEFYMTYQVEKKETSCRSPIRFAPLGTILREGLLRIRYFISHSSKLC